MPSRTPISTIKVMKFRIARRAGPIFVCLLAVALSLSSARAQAVRGLDAVRVAGGFSLPVFVTAPPGDTGRLFVVQQSGQIRIIDLASGTVKEPPFLSLSVATSRRARPPRAGLRSELRQQRLLLRQLHRAGRVLESGHDARFSLHRLGQSRSGRRGERKNYPFLRSTANQSQRRLDRLQPARGRRGQSLHRERRRRVGQRRRHRPHRAGRQRAEPHHPAREDVAHSSSTADGTYSIPADNPFVRHAATCARRSGPTACAIRSGTVSIAR